MPVNPAQGLGAAGGPAQTTCSGERSAQPSDRKAESRQANVFIQRLEQVGGPSANLSQLPLQAGTNEKKEGGPGEAGRGTVKPPRVSVRCVETSPSSPSSE